MTHLRHLHSRHRTDVEAENLRSIVSNHKTLHLPLVYRKIASLDIKVAITREAQHVLTLGVPGHTISIRLLQENAGGNNKPYSRTCVILTHANLFLFQSEFLF